MKKNLSKGTQTEVLDLIRNHLLDVFAFNCFRDELKYFFENKKVLIKTIDGEEIELSDFFTHKDFEGIIDLKLRFADEEN